jgi:hypothetical protein
MRPANVLLKPGETRTVQIVVHMPGAQSNVAPVAWGGILLKATRPNLNSQLTPGATVVVYNAAQQFEPQLQLSAFSVQRAPKSARFVARIKNPGQTYVRPLVHLSLDDGSAIARSIDIPFNAILPGDERTLRAEVGHLHAGSYRAELTIEYDDNAVIEGETHVTVR